MPYCVGVCDTKHREQPWSVAVSFGYHHLRSLLMRTLKTRLEPLQTHPREINTAPISLGALQANKPSSIDRERRRSCPHPARTVDLGSNGHKGLQSVQLRHERIYTAKAAKLTSHLVVPRCVVGASQVSAEGDVIHEVGVNAAPAMDWGHHWGCLRVCCSPLLWRTLHPCTRPP